MSLLVGIIIMIIALVVYYLSYTKSRTVTKLKLEFGIPEGKITYTDLDKPNKPIFSNRLKLVGKPDYIVKRNEKYIPVELKSGSPDIPFKNHVLQLAAYCLILEDVKRTRVPFGVLAYGNHQHIIPFDKNLRKELKEVIDEIRSKISEKVVKRNHNFANRCMFCSFRDYCDVKLA